jgi:hypothetical protein
VAAQPFRLSATTIPLMAAARSNRYAPRNCGLPPRLRAVPRSLPDGVSGRNRSDTHRRCDVQLDVGQTVWLGPAGRSHRRPLAAPATPGDCPSGNTSACRAQYPFEAACERTVRHTGAAVWGKRRRRLAAPPTGSATRPLQANPWRRPRATPPGHRTPTHAANPPQRRCKPMPQPRSRGISAPQSNGSRRLPQRQVRQGEPLPSDGPAGFARRTDGHSRQGSRRNYPSAGQRTVHRIPCARRPGKRRDSTGP